MQIIVVGCGKMGMELANRLVTEGHDVTVIDRSEAVLEHCLDTLDVMTVKGSGVSFDALTEADVKHADIVIASTMSDETNMLTCLTAKRLGAKYAIARIRDPEYLGSLSSLSKELSIDYVVNPERATAREISRILRLPFAVSIETFARGLVEMVEFRADGTEPFCGVTLDHYARTTKLPRVLFCAVERGHQPYIPKGDFTIQAGDAVFVAAEPATITEFFKGLGKNTRGAHNAMIVGGSRIAYYLAGLLHDCAKCLPLSQMVKAAKDEKLDPVMKESKALMHAVAGMHLAQDVYDVHDPEVLGAIRWHTTGHANMTRLEKIVYLADMIEPNRKPYPGLKALRKLCMTDLDEAMHMALRMSLDHVREQGKPLHPDTMAALAEYEPELV